MDSITCSLCKKTGHSSSNCPDLHDPLKEGFYSGGGDAQHTHNEEEETIKCKAC